MFWVEQVPGTERRRYERLRGVPITRVTPAGRSVRAPPASYYLPATYTSATRPELRKKLRQFQAAQAEDVRSQKLK